MTSSHLILTTRPGRSIRQVEREKEKKKGKRTWSKRKRGKCEAELLAMPAMPCPPMPCLAQHQPSMLLQKRKIPRRFHLCVRKFLHDHHHQDDFAAPYALLSVPGCFHSSSTFCSMCKVPSTNPDLLEFPAQFLAQGALVTFRAGMLGISFASPWIDGLPTSGVA
jgi:hypothetical protein